jgi:CRISPR-associated endonuclease/helicase Cas3
VFDVDIEGPWAHSKNQRGERHSLVAHLEATAKLTQEFASAFGAGDLGWWLGLWHDVGKFAPEWQRYLLEAEAWESGGRVGPRPPRTDHKAAGAKLARQHMGKAVALAAQGHHGGLRSRPEFDSWFAGVEERGRSDSVLAVARATITGLEPAGRLTPPDLPNATSGEFFVRMLFSALVDADSLDTEAHTNPNASARRLPATGIEVLWDRLAEHVGRFADRGGNVAGVRREVYKACVLSAERAPGLFRLTVPTGGGKTLSGMAFALRHALFHGLRRVVVAVPYLTITDQTAAVYRKVFERGGEPSPVLEHHTNVEEPDDEEGWPTEEALRRRLAAENWDAPIVITTTVQLFESMFARGRSRCRKLHRLARSVVILDEAQSLPAELLTPLLDGLRELCSPTYGSTVVLSTATQPAFEHIEPFRKLPSTEIVPNYASHFLRLRRVTYEWRTERPMSWAEVAVEMGRHDRALAVVNTRKDAIALLDALEDPRALHISTWLCGAHRRAVIAEINARLGAGDACRLVSTQVVEAGVDIDFPVVLRALGPLDSIIQAAGRCNREGAPTPGLVIVFRPVAGGLPPGSYSRGAHTTDTLLNAGRVDPDDPEAIREYFRRLYLDEGTDARGVQEYREAFDYPEVDHRVRFIEDTERLIIMDYGTSQEQEMIRAAVAALRDGRGNQREVRRRVERFTVSARKSELRRYVGLITPVCDGFWQWHGRYDTVRGLVAETDLVGLVG